MGIREFDGELDSANVKEFTGELDPEPGLLDPLYKAANKLFKVGSVMDGAPAVSAGTPNPANDAMVQKILAEQAEKMQPSLTNSNTNFVDGPAGIAQVAGRRGLAGLREAVGGAAMAAGDAFNIPALSEFGTQTNEAAQSYGKGVQLKSGNVDGFSPNSIVQELPQAAANAGASIIQTAPGLIANVAVPGSGLPLLFGQVGAQEYGQGVEAGLTGPGAALRAIPMGAAEVIGEKLGGFNALSSGIRQSVTDNSVEPLAKALLQSAAREVPGEELTTTLQFLTDKAPGIGTNQDATFADYTKAVKDTALATLLQSGGMAGGGMALQAVADRAAPTAPAMPVDAALAPASQPAPAAPKKDVSELSNAIASTASIPSGNIVEVPDDIQLDQPNSNSGEFDGIKAQEPEAPAEEPVGGIEKLQQDFKAARESNNLQAMMDTTSALSGAVMDDAQSTLDNGEMAVYKNGNGLLMAVHPSPNPKYKYQVTTFNDTGAIGDTQHYTLQDALSSNGLSFKSRTSGAEAEALMNKAAQAEGEFQSKKDAPEIDLPEPGIANMPLSQSGAALMAKPDSNDIDIAPVINEPVRSESSLPQPKALLDKAMQLTTATAGLRPGDIVSSEGAPFATKQLAQKVKKDAGPGWVIKRSNGGFVVRNQPQTPKQIAATKARIREASSVDKHKDSMFAAIAKLGGINAADVKSEWGISDDLKGLRGAGIKRVATDGGKSVDAMGEALAELGYLSVDEHGKYDMHEFEDLFGEELGGSKHFTPEGFENKAQEDHAQAYEDHLSEKDIQDSGYDELSDGQNDIERFIDEYPETDAELEERLEREGRELDSELARSSGTMETDDGDEIPFSAKGGDGRIGQAPSGATTEQNSEERTGNVGESAGTDRPEFELATHDKTDLAKRARLAEQEAANASASKNADNAAAASTSDFTLTGSDRAADVGAARGQASLFSKNKQQSGLSVDQVREAIANDSFGQEVDVYATLDDAPVYVQEQAKSEGAIGVEGFFDNRTGRVALIAENLESAERAVQVARHELIGHYGLEGMVGKEEMSRLAKRVIQAEKEGNKTFAEVSKHVDRTQPGLSPERRAKEIIAVMAERNMQNSIVRRVIDAIRKFLNSIGIKQELTDAEVSALLRDAQEYLRDNGRSMIAGEPAAMFSASESELEKKLDAAGIDHAISENKGKLTISKFVVAKDRRGQGDGTKAMQDVIDYADSKGLTVTLTPSVDFGGSSVDRLKKFYKQFGFVENKGKGRDFAINDTMYREPDEAAFSAKGQTDTAYPLQDPPEYEFSNYKEMGGRIAYMTPDQFIAATKPLKIDESSQDNIDDLVNMMRDGRKIDPPRLTLDGGAVTSHDGRHRAYAAKELGIKQLPVLMIDTGRGAIAPDMAEVTGQAGNRVAFSAKGNTQSAMKLKPEGIKAKDFVSVEKDKVGRKQSVAGRKIYDKIANAATDILGKVKLADNAPDSFKKIMRDFRVDQTKAQANAKNVAKIGMAQLTADERKMLSDIIEGYAKVGDMTPDAVVEIAASIQAALHQQGEDLVELGMISRDRLIKNYLPRAYRNPLLARFTNKDIFKSWYQKSRLRISGARLKSRGLVHEIKGGDWAKYKRLGWKLGSMSDGSDIPADLVEAIKKGTEVPPHYPADLKFIVWRDFTMDEREKMGEIHDGLLRYALGYVETQKDIAIGRLFTAIANNKELSSKVNPGGWAQVPDREVPGADGVKQYGALSGMYVPDYVRDQIERNTQPKGPLMAAYDTALNFWKEGKTVWNPVAHGNNIISNVFTAHFAGLNVADPRVWRNTAKEYRTKGKYYQEAVDSGLFGTEWASVEIQEMFMPDIVGEADIETISASRFNKVVNTLKKAGKPVSFYREKMQAAYQFEDQFFKLMMFIDRRKGGASIEDSINDTERYIFNYADVPEGVQVLKRTYSPFISYTYKALPMLIHTALTRPDRLIAPIALLGGANWLAYAMIGGDEDEERKNMPEYMKGNTAIGTPKSVRMPFNIGDRPAFMDMSRRVPLGDLFDMNNQTGGMEVPAPMMPSHPLFTATAALMFNKDTFSGKDVTKASDTDWEVAQKRADWIFKQIVPNAPFIPGAWNFDKLMNGAANAFDTEMAGYTGYTKAGDATPLGLALLDVVGGTKIRSFDPARNKDFKEYEISKEQKEIKANIRSAMRNQAMPSEKRESYITDQREKMKELSKKRQEL